jgi:hypothetical protein
LFCALFFALRAKNRAQEIEKYRSAEGKLLITQEMTRDRSPRYPEKDQP